MKLNEEGGVFREGKKMLKYNFFLKNQFWPNKSFGGTVKKLQKFAQWLNFEPNMVVGVLCTQKTPRTLNGEKIDLGGSAWTRRRHGPRCSSVGPSAALFSPGHALGCHRIGYGSDIVFTISASTPNLRIRILTDVKKWYLYPSKSDIGYGSDINGSDADTNWICKNKYSYG